MASNPNRDSQRMSKALKRNSRFYVPYDVVDFRNSWPVDQRTGQHYPPPGFFNPDQKAPIAEDDEQPLTRYETADSLYKENAKVQVDEVGEGGETVLGSTDIFDKDGNLRLIPVCSGS